MNQQEFDALIRSKAPVREEPKSRPLGKIMMGLVAIVFVAVKLGAAVPLYEIARKHFKSPGCEPTTQIKGGAPQGNSSSDCRISASKVSGQTGRS